MISYAAGRTAVGTFGVVNVRAAGTDANGKPKGPPTFDMVAYTGGPLLLKNWDAPLVIDQTGWMDLDHPRPALRDHDPNKLVGHIDQGQTTVNAAGELVASGTVSANNEHSAEVIDTAKNKFPWKASVGASVKQAEFVPEGESAQANGRDWPGPLYIGRRSSLPEISFVPIGADDNTSITVAAEAAGVIAMTNFQTWAKARGIDLDTLDDVQITALKEAFKALSPDVDPDAPAPEDDSDDAEADGDDDDADAAAPPAAPPAAPAKKKKGLPPPAAADGLALINVTAAGSTPEHVQVVRRQILAETQRINRIIKICGGKHGEVQARAIEENWTPDQTELKILRLERPKAAAAAGGSFGINVGAGGQLTQEVFAAGCAINAGVQEKYALAGLNEQQKNLAVTRQVRDLSSSIYGMFAVVAAASGMTLPAHRMTDSVIRAGWELSGRQANADGGVGFSSMSIPGITENVLNKMMLQSYDQVKSIVADICFQTGLLDFRVAKRYRMTAGGVLAEVGPTGELKHLTLTDESYPVTATTQGGLLVIDRQTWRNDDMGALVQIPMILGKRAAITREKLVIQTFVASFSTVAPGASVGKTANAFNFISAGANNLLTGAASALSMDAVTAARAKLMNQKDVSGEPIFVEGDRLLVPPALVGTAEGLFNSTDIIASGLASTAAKSLQTSKNIHQGRYRPVSSPYLGAGSNIPGTTDTGWGFLGDPSTGIAPFTIGYVDNQRVPIIQRGELSFDQLGMGVRAIWDFGVSAADYRTIIWNAGQ